MQISKYCLLLLLYLIPTVELKSEIQNVRLQWTPGQCNEGCINLLSRVLPQMVGVSSVNINAPVGEATLYWKPNYKFAYKDIDYNFRRVGLANRDTYIKVRGTIRHRPDYVELVSIGDNTVFKLLGSMLASSSEYVIKHNPLSYPLAPELKLQLLQWEEENKIITIAGQLYDPYRYYYSNYLIINHIDVEKTQSKGIEKSEP